MNQDSACSVYGMVILGSTELQENAQKLNARCCEYRSAWFLGFFSGAKMHTFPWLLIGARQEGMNPSHMAQSTMVSLQPLVKPSAQAVFEHHRLTKLYAPPLASLVPIKVYFEILSK